MSQIASAIDLGKFDKFHEQMRGVVDSKKEGVSPPPWGYPSAVTAAMLGPPLDEAAPHLPGPYREAYFRPLYGSLDRLVVSHDGAAEVALLAEALAGAVYQHSRKYPRRDQLRQFLAVVSNYYRSFLSKAKRAALDAPPAAAGLPPLAVFRHRGDIGPFTLSGDVMRQLCGSEVGVVCLPESYAAAPVTWLTLAHETAGHDVLHADPTLLPDLTAGVRTIFGGGLIQPGEPVDESQLLALLWGYWVDEAASDVYAVLNAGPAFAYNLAAFLSAFRGGLKSLSVDADSGSRWADDPHPPDVLRLHAAAGVIESLTGMGSAERRSHAANVRQLADQRAAGGTALQVRGRVELERDHWIDLDEMSLPLPAACEAARRVGAYIATTRLRTFGGRSVQDVETWDAADADIAARIAVAFVKGDAQRVRVMGDDAQLLAGATLAVLDQPVAYPAVNRLLADALTLSFATDPVVGFPLYHRMLDIAPAPPPAPPDSTAEDDPHDAAPKPPGPAVTP